MHDAFVSNPPPENIMNSKSIHSFIDKCLVKLSNKGLSSRYRPMFDLLHHSWFSQSSTGMHFQLNYVF